MDNLKTGHYPRQGVNLFSRRNLALKALKVGAFVSFLMEGMARSPGSVTCRKKVLRVFILAEGYFGQGPPQESGSSTPF